MAVPSRYHVFLSFRGADTREDFTNWLYHDLERIGLNVFMDDEEIRTGDNIEDTIKDAVYDSKLFLPIFSKGYASSKWCLKEIEWMVDCMEKFPEKKILPVFYNVDADDVKLKTNLYKEQLDHHKEASRTVERWAEALKKAAQSKGWNRKDTARDVELVDKISRHVSCMLEIKHRNLPTLIGIEEQVEDREKELEKDVLMVVIHGMGGMGKTTLAGAVFNRICSQFQFASFLSNIRESSTKNGIVELQKRLLQDADRFSSHNICDENDGMNKLKGSLRRKKALVILDDVDDMAQIEKLIGMGAWLELGSKVIVTTRNSSCVANVDEITNKYVSLQGRRIRIYEMKEIHQDASLRLFYWHAFRKDEPHSDYEQISRDIISLTRGVPLAIEVVGSNLRGGRIEIWKEMLNKLKKVPHEKLYQPILQSSYQALSEEAKEIFLDIAFLFAGQDKTKAFYYWEACRLSPNMSVDNLISYALIKIDDYNKFWMHDLIKDLGREVDRRRSNGILGKRSRLCNEDAQQFLRQGEGSKHVKALQLCSDDLAGAEIELPRLSNLKFLESRGIDFTGDPPPELRWLSLVNCGYFNKTNLNLNKLEVLSLSCFGFGEINHTWAGWEQLKNATSLKSLELHALKLTDTPDVSSFLNSERLTVTARDGLVQIDPWMAYINSLNSQKLGNQASICNFKALTSLSISGSNITQLPENIGDLKFLKTMEIEGCEQLENLPDSIGGLESLWDLWLWENGITQLPESIGKLRKLINLHVSNSKLLGLPTSICDLVSLQVLDVNGNKHLRGEIPGKFDQLQSLETLNLSETGISGLPVGIGCLSRLCSLSLHCCNNIQVLHNLPASLTELEFSSVSLKAVPDLSSLTNLVNLNLSIYSYDDDDDGLNPLVSRGNTMSWIQHLQKLEDLTTHLHPLLPSVLNSRLDKLPRLKRLDFTGEIPSELSLPSRLKFFKLNGSSVTEMRLNGSEWKWNLAILDICNCEFLERVNDISGLQKLKELHISKCPKLVEIGGLEKLLRSLRELSISECDSIPCLPNPSDTEMHSNPRLRVHNCRMLRNYNYNGPYEGYFRGEESMAFE